MRLKLYQIDAFTKKVFSGNPAAVCPLEYWLEDDVLQKIADENNLSETAFFVKEDNSYKIRWFTPTSEVDMCGHATLASAYVLFEYLNFSKNEIIFNSKSGILKIKKENGRLEMDFPTQEIIKTAIPTNIYKAFNIEPIECFKSMDYILVFENEEDIINAKPKFELLKSIDARGVIITAKSEKYDFVNRFFAPKVGIDEDPVTGSAFTQLSPYWSKIFNKSSFSAKQLSKRGGEVFCELKGSRVIISGYCKKYLEGIIEL